MNRWLLKMLVLAITAVVLMVFVSRGRSWANRNARMASCADACGLAFEPSPNDHCPGILNDALARFWDSWWHVDSRLFRASFSGG